MLTFNSRLEAMEWASHNLHQITIQQAQELHAKHRIIFVCGRGKVKQALMLLSPEEIINHSPF